MMDFIIKHPVLVGCIVMSVISTIVCIYDKLAAKHWPKHRTPEATLLLLSALGGSVAMYVTMQIIRHKTLHKKFMIGIPVILVLQITLVVLYYYFVK